MFRQRRLAEVPEQPTDREQVHQAAVDTGWSVRRESDRLVQYEHPYSSERIELWFDSEGRIEPEYDPGYTPPPKDSGQNHKDRRGYVWMVRELMHTYASAPPLLVEASIGRLKKVTRDYDRQIDQFGQFGQE